VIWLLVWAFVVWACVRRPSAVSRLYGQEPFVGKSGDSATGDWTPSALDRQFALMLETYNDQSQTSCIALFKVDLSEMANQQGCGAVLYRLSIGRA